MAVKYEEEEKPEVQLTSMMDCIFLMLIFFLVSSQLKKVEKELPIELPRANTTRDVKSTPDLITVSVNAKGELFVNSKPVGDAGLKNALANAAKENPDRRIRINGGSARLSRCSTPARARGSRWSASTPRPT